MTRLFIVLLKAGFTEIGLLFINDGLPRTTTVVCEPSQPEQIDCHQQDITAGIPSGKQTLPVLQSIQLISFEVPAGDGDMNVPRHQISSNYSGIQNPKNVSGYRAFFSTAIDVAVSI